MVTAVNPLPEDALRRLMGAYAREVGIRRRLTLLGLFVFALCTALAAIQAEIDPAKFANNAWRFTSYIRDITPKLGWATLGTDLAEWYWGWRPWLRLLGETLMIAYMGTVLGAIGGFVLCFFAAQNLTSTAWIRFIARRFLEFCRTVPQIVFALIFVIAFGLGPVPGVLAIALHTIGALGKLFFEVVENIDMKPVDGITATGATWPKTIRFAVIPQVLSNFASYALLRFEVNVREATVMGFVGAGGIGQELLVAVRKFYYSDVSAILLMVIVTVTLIDLFTDRLRHRLIGMESGR